MRKKQKKKTSLSITTTTTTTTPNTSSYFFGWADLPGELLDEIFARLSGTDRHLFGWICSPWRGIARFSCLPFPVPFEPPRLLLHQSDNSISFFDVFNRKPRHCPLITPSHRRSRCLGYHLGWFVLVSDQDPSKVCLLNPVLATEIPLPDLEFPIKKAILSAPPGFPNCVVAVVGQSDSLALCEPAGNKWHRIDLWNRTLRDVIFWHNQVCALDKHGKILICDFDTDLQVTCIETVESPKPEIWDPEVDGFLVESIHGKLIIVIRYGENRFLLFELYRNMDDWWGDVHDLGNLALFLGEIRSEFVPVNRFPGSGLKKNSIYLTGKKFGNVVKVHSRWPRSNGILALPVPQQHSALSEPVWVSPVIWP